MVRDTTSLKARVDPNPIMLRTKANIMVRKIDHRGRLVRGSTYQLLAWILLIGA